MNRYTDEEIVAKVEEIWKDKYLTQLDVRVVKNEPDEVRIEIGQMFEYIETTFDKLLQLSQFFGTQQIGDERYAMGGCETCDYGSSYEVTFRIRPEPVD